MRIGAREMAFDEAIGPLVLEHVGRWLA
jgi:hypothetical protein